MLSTALINYRALGPSSAGSTAAPSGPRCLAGGRRGGGRRGGRVGRDLPEDSDAAFQYRRYKVPCTQYRSAVYGTAPLHILRTGYRIGTGYRMGMEYRMRTFIGTVWDRLEGGGGIVWDRYESRGAR
jgi:hypothetical protein